MALLQKKSSFETAMAILRYRSDTSGPGVAGCAHDVLGFQVLGAVSSPRAFHFRGFSQHTMAHGRELIESLLRNASGEIELQEFQGFALPHIKPRSGERLGRALRSIHHALDELRADINDGPSTARAERHIPVRKRENERGNITERPLAGRD